MRRLGSLYRLDMSSSPPRRARSCCFCSGAKALQQPIGAGPIFNVTTASPRRLGSCWQGIPSPEPEDITIIYLRLGKIYLEEPSYNDLKMAKTMYLWACELFPSAQSWLGVGIACIYMDQFDEAEDALSEATVLSNREANVWGYLALLYLRTDRTFEANQALKQGLIHGIKHTDLLRYAD